MRLIGFAGRRTIIAQGIAARVFKETQARECLCLEGGFYSSDEIQEFIRQGKSVAIFDLKSAEEASDIKHIGGVVVEILDPHTQSNTSLQNYVDYTVTDCGILREYIDTLRVLYKRIAPLGER